MVVVTALLVGTGTLGWAMASDRGATASAASSSAASTSAASSTSTSARPAGTSPSASPSARPQARPRRPSGSTASRVGAPLPSARPSATPPPGPRLLGPGDAGTRVRDLQARLRQISWYVGDVGDDYGPATTAAVRGFQAKRRIAVTGYVDQRSLDRLGAMTRQPTTDELANRLPGSTTTTAALDERCTTGRALCVDKTSSTVRWVVDGTVRRTMAVRFGSAYTPTREGLFHVDRKSRDHVSNLYGSSMPFAMFFSGGQAVHYSSDFAARGYAGASHGCVNVRDLAGIAWLFDQVAVGDAVVVYRS